MNEERIQKARAEALGAGRAYRPRYPVTVKRAFVALLETGMSVKEAARELGIPEWTGSRWAEGLR